MSKEPENLGQIKRMPKHNGFSIGHDVWNDIRALLQRRLDYQRSLIRHTLSCDAIAKCKELEELGEGIL